MHNNTQIILLSGKAQSGKDTASEAIEGFLYRQGFTSKSYALADPIKDICANIFDIDRSLLFGSKEDKNQDSPIVWGDLPLAPDNLSSLMRKMTTADRKIYKSTHMTIRELLQVFGTDICRRMYGDCWVIATKNRILADHCDFAIITDNRFPNEIDYFMNTSPVVVRFDRNPLGSQHESEIALDSYDWAKLKYCMQLDNTNMSLVQKNIEVVKYIEKFTIENNGNGSSS